MVHKIRRFMLVAIPVVIGISCVDSGDAALSVPLTIKERSGANRVDEPATYGVPLAKSMNIRSTSDLGIFDSGSEVDAQFRVLSRYGGPPEDGTKPIRMVLCDVQATVGAGQAVTYRLEDTGSGTAAEPNIASEDTSHVILSTGKMIMKIRKTGYFNMFDEVYIDAEPDGQVDDQIVSPSAQGGIIVRSGGTTYASYNAPPTSVGIEENGPLRAVVKVRGFYKDSRGMVASLMGSGSTGTGGWTSEISPGGRTMGSRPFITTGTILPLFTVCGLPTTR